MQMDEGAPKRNRASLVALLGGLLCLLLVPICLILFKPGHSDSVGGGMAVFFMTFAGVGLLSWGLAIIATIGLLKNRKSVLAWSAFAVCGIEAAVGVLAIIALFQI